MKIVINKCFGGFSLSPLAVKRMAELRGVPCYLFEDHYSGGSRTYGKPVPIEKLTGRYLFFSAFTIPNPDKVLQRGGWHKMSDEARKEYNDLYESVSLSTRPDNRADPLLVQVVEELGEKANGACADLSVVEIPDGIEWFIDEYDGLESVHEAHRTWG